MPKPHVDRRRRIQPLVAAVVQPVAKRLARMEDLLLEMRHEQDVKLKRITAVEAKLNTLIEYLIVSGRHTRRASPSAISLEAIRKGR